MSDLYQTPVGMPEEIMAANEPHLACVLLLDTSGSMSGGPINSLNEALKTFKEQTVRDELAARRVDICVITFDSEVRVVQEFVPLPMMEPITLVAGGMTSMGTGINLAIDKVKERNRFYAEMGTPCFQPWIFMITDGAPTDDITAARTRIKEEESKGSHGKLKFWALGVNGYDAKTLTSLTKRCIALDGADFSGIFNWLSESMSVISVSKPGENPALNNLPDDAHTIPSDW